VARSGPFSTSAASAGGGGGGGGGPQEPARLLLRSLSPVLAASHFRTGALRASSFCRSVLACGGRTTMCARCARLSTYRSKLNRLRRGQRSGRAGRGLERHLLGYVSPNALHWTHFCHRGWVMCLLGGVAPLGRVAVAPCPVVDPRKCWFFTPYWEFWIAGVLLPWCCSRGRA